MRFAAVALAILTVAAVIFGALNFDQRRKYASPDDGVTWRDTLQGVQSLAVDLAGPGQRAGIKPGDYVGAVNGVEVHRVTQVTRQLFRAGAWSHADYKLERHGTPFETSLIVAPQDISSSIKTYLAFVGLLYLFIGVFIFVKRWSAPKAVHFYVFCLVSFILYSFSSTGKLNTFDWIIYWSNVVALLLQPALFLHFALVFPERKSWVEKHAWVLPAVYAPGLLLLLAHITVATQTLGFLVPSLETRWLLDRVAMIHLAAYFVAAAAVLEHTYRHAHGIVLKQQLKWVTRGTLLGTLPFAVLYAVPFFLGLIPRPWMKLSALSLIFIPLTFGYAIVRYRLMDVDIIFKRGMAYTLATASIVALYFVVVAGLGEFFRTSIPSTGTIGWLLAIVITALLFQPIKDWIQYRLDRFFYRDRYDYRRTLLEFGRELSSEVHLEKLYRSIMDRLSRTLVVDRISIFLEDPVEPGRFYLAKSFGLSYDSHLDLRFLDPERPEFRRGYLFYENPRQVRTEPEAVRPTLTQLDLHYYIPCKAQNRTIGFLGLGKTIDGDFLSSEDVELLQTIAGYVAIAIENARLYQSLEQKAEQIERLKDFSENIIESINVGILAADWDDRIESWNSQMERIYGVPREAAVGKRLEELFPPELLAELALRRDEPRVSCLYKFHLKNREARTLIMNIFITPLLGKSQDALGRLLIFDDVTERVHFERQLMQAEKLTSISLLAAGVAHEVNTPLAVISNYAQMLAKQMAGDEQKSKLLDKIIKQTFRASEIINALLNFSRTTGTEFGEVDLNKVIRETLALMEHQFKVGRVEVESALGSELPTIYGNVGKLQQVFLNLFLNAKDAMPRGGRLTIATTGRDSTVQVEVTDTGVGIPRENLHRIYDPFFTTKATNQGTGLGLAVTYGIVREHSGKIQVSSAPGKGTSFRLEFPTVRKPVNV